MNAKMPEPVKEKCGCKVAWAWYATEADARRVAEKARADAVTRAEQGYAFGYCSPGEVERDGELWKVTLP